MISRILVALDASPRAPGVLGAAAEIASRFGAKLTLFRALHIPPDFPPAAHVDQGDPLPVHLTKQAFTSLEALAAALPEDLRTSASLVRVGQSWRTILEVADEIDADLIVIGSHGYYAIDRVLGTTAGKVANLAHRNVLVVHEKTTARTSQPPP
jgi:nucleotide-binding universal stress UspA family protein